jgi:hypothetical protein
VSNRLGKKTFPLLLLSSFLATACATTSSKRPPCTWELWAVEGKLVRSDDNRTLPCQGPGAADCVGMKREDLFNLLTCGGEKGGTKTPERP